MSTAETGDASVAREAIDRSRAVFEAAVSEEAEQLDLLSIPTPEAMAEARDRLGPNAGRLTVLREARKGRPPGARNKRTDDYARFLLSHGQDPGVVMIQLASTPPEVLMEASRRTVVKVTKDGSRIEYQETMSYGEALSLIMRAAEGAQPYINSKKPVAIDATIRGVRVIEEVSDPNAQRDAIETEFVRVAHAGEVE